MIINALKDFLNTCPYLLGQKINVDFLDKDSGAYSINPVECQPIIKRYAGGECLKQFVFTISGREDYDETKTTENAALYESIGNWIESSYLHNSLPALGNNKIPQKIEVLSSGHLFFDDINSAGYMIKCRLIYLDNL